MAYTNPLDPTTPAATDQVKDGDDRIREAKAALIERIQTFFTDTEAQPWQSKDSASFGTLAPATAGKDVGLTGTPFRDLWLSRTAQLQQGTLTAQAPGLNHTVTWNGAGITFQGWVMQVTDTASAASSLLINLLVGGQTVFNVTKAGALTLYGAAQNGPGYNPALTITSLGAGGVALPIDFIHPASSGNRNWRVGAQIITGNGFDIIPSTVADGATFTTPVFSILYTGAATIVGDLTLNTLTVGLGAGAVATNTAFGFQALAANTAGSTSTAVGYRALKAATTGQFNIAMGGQALSTLTTGQGNTALGYNALQSVVVSNGNTACGDSALATTTGSNNIGLGNAAGAYATSDNEFFINAFDRANYAGDKAKSLIYGVMNVTAASQTLALNAAVTIPYTLGVSGAATFAALTATSLVATAGFGCNSKTAQTAYSLPGNTGTWTVNASPGAGYGFDSIATATGMIALVAAIQAALKANGIGV